MERLRQAVRDTAADLLQETLAVTRIPAPTFAEAERAAYVAGRLQQFGLRDVERDEIHNVCGRLPGAGGGPTLLLAAHTDTVFPAGTNVEPRFDGRYWRAPGIRDNSASVALTLHLPAVLARAGITLPGDLILGFPVGEEGLGDLRGMRALLRRFRGQVAAVCVVDGNLGHICNAGICVRRLEVTGRTRGGHSWGNFGATSAIHALARMAARISRIEVPRAPKTTYNVGTFHGGTSVNTIAPEASMLLDLRSVDPGALALLEQQVRDAIAGEARAFPDLDLEIRVVGDRPGGRVQPTHPVVQTALAAYRQVGIEGRLQPGSTDANIPLSLGLPACSFGISSGGGVHTLEEYLDPDSLVPGMEALAAWVILLMGALSKSQRST